jgi:hypothetical protein
MERAIGFLVGGIQSDVEPFLNLCQISRRHCQINALLSVLPELDLAEKGNGNGTV